MHGSPDLLALANRPGVLHVFGHYHYRERRAIALGSGRSWPVGIPRPEVDTGMAALVARRSKPDDFLGVNVAPEIRDRFAAFYQRPELTTSIDVARIQDNAYAAASLQAHPQTRLRPSNLAEHEDGSLVITFEERDRPHQYNGAVTLAAGSIGLADTAARLRLSGATRPPAPTPEG